MQNNRSKAVKEITNIINGYPNFNSKRVNYYALLGMFIGFIVGLILDFKFLSSIYSMEISSKGLKFLLANINSLNYPRYGTFFNVSAIPLFSAMIGTLAGLGIERLAKKK